MGIIKLNRKFGLITGSACIALFAYQLVFKHRPLIYVGGIGCVLILLALVLPQVLNPLRLIWDKIGTVLGTINTALILFVVFFLMVTPLGWILRALKKNLIALKWKSGDKTYWQKADTTETSSYKQQF